MTPKLPRLPAGHVTMNKLTFEAWLAKQHVGGLARIALRTRWEKAWRAHKAKLDRKAQRMVVDRMGKLESAAFIKQFRVVP